MKFLKRFLVNLMILVGISLVVPYFTKISITINEMAIIFPWAFLMALAEPPTKKFWTREKK